MKLISRARRRRGAAARGHQEREERVEIAVFRFDRTDIETALKAAAARGVKVTALIAFANRGGEQRLRKLELRCLDAGIIVARTSDDLIRYHDKYILIDRRVLYVLSFNFTHLDIDHSRGFGIVTTHANWVREAARLFRADCTRSKYTPKTETFVVSPANARKVLDTFLKTGEDAIADLRPQDLGQGDASYPAGAGEGGRRDQGHRLGGWARPVRRADSWPATAAHAHDHPRPAPGLRRQPEPSRRGTGLAPRTRPDCSGREGREDADRDIRIRLGQRERQGRRRPDRPSRKLPRASRRQSRRRKQRRPFRSSRRNWIRSRSA